MSQSLVNLKIEGGVAVLMLNDPPANTYTYEMFLEFDKAVLECRMNQNVHVMVVTGFGEKFFCAGANIKMLSEVDPTFKYYFCLHANETLSRLEQTPKLTIAALNGHTVGGGLEIAMACDLRIARKGGGKVGLPEIALGVLPGTGGTQRLARIIGKSKAIEMMISGQNMEFEDAEKLGIVNQIYESQGFMERVMEYAKSFCPPHKASRAVGRIKRSVQSGTEMSFEYGLALERELQQQLFQSQDAKEGLTAYVQKRTPQFKGA
jgi:enoyl-CoA hydratase